MQKLLKDNLKAGLLLGVIAVIVTLFKYGGPIIGSIIGFFGYRKSRRALKEGKSLGAVGIILNGFPIIYLLITLFILGYIFFVR